MNPAPQAVDGDKDAEIATLIATLHRTEERLEELTGGQVDTVTGQSGRPFLLRRAQEDLRHSEAEKQAAILNALPAQIAVLDAQGNIVSVNETWRQLAMANQFTGPQFSIGCSYLAVCDRVGREASVEAQQAAAGIRAVLAGAKIFSLEYPCHGPKEERWFQMLVTPLAHLGARGAIVMHLNITARRQAEEATRESDERFAGAFEHAPIGVALVSPEGRWLRVNRALCDLLGFSAEELKARTFQSITNPADLAKDLELVRRILAGEIDTYQLEKRYIHADGHDIKVLINVSLVHDSEGRPSYFIAQVLDVTKRELAVAALQQQQTELRVLVDLMPAMVWFKDTKNGFLRVNQRVAESTGLRVEEIEGKSAYEIFPEEAVAYYADDLEVIRSRMPKLGIIEQLHGPQGGKIWIQTDKVPVFDQEGKVSGLIAMVHDITERKEADAVLRASEARFKALFEQAAVGVALTEAATGRFVQVNQRFTEIAGRSRVELEQLTFAEITHPQDVAHDLENMQRMREGVIREFTRDKRYMLTDGTERWVNLTVSAMWTLGEAPGLCMVVVQDITGRKQMEEQIRQVQKLDAIGTLAGGIAHDFNNILAAIGGYTELARMTLTGNPVVRDHLGAVLQAVQRAANLVRQILTFSRQQPIERRPVQLQPLLEETFHLLRATIPTTIQFELSLAEDAPQVLADATQIHQIMMNLGTNAWHAMKDQNGRLTVSLERVVVDEAQAATQPKLRPGLYARVAVSDTGRGMDPVTLRRIFEPFFTTKPAGEGTGLGLSAVHGIMDSHDGAITVESKLGVGTVFHVYFPEHVGEVPVVADAITALVRGQGERILVVDDEAMLAEMIQESLSMLGYAAKAVTDPAAALDLVRADPQHFALVLTDLTMPGMTGLMLAARLRQIRPDLPVILLTGYNITLTAAHVKAEGLHSLLQKPISIQSLGTAVHAALSSLVQRG